MTTSRKEVKNYDREKANANAKSHEKSIRVNKVNLFVRPPMSNLKKKDFWNNVKITEKKRILKTLRTLFVYCFGINVCLSFKSRFRTKKFSFDLVITLEVIVKVHSKYNIERNP